MVLKTAGRATQGGEATSQPDERRGADLPCEAIEARHDEAQRAAVISELVGGMLHDFNNVLTVITGTIEILAEAVADRPELAAIARLIEDAAMRGAALTSHLLAFARGRPSCPRDTDVNALLVEACRLLRSTLGEQIEIALLPASEVPSELPWALADPDALMAAILSLAIAARNAMPDGGKFTFQVAGQRSQVSPARATGERAEAGVVIAMHICGQAIGDQIDRIELEMAEDFTRQAGGRITALRQARDAARVEILLPETASLLG